MKGTVAPEAPPASLPAAIAAVRNLGDECADSCKMLGELCFNSPRQKELAVRMGALPALVAAASRPASAAAALKALRIVSSLSAPLKSAAGDAGCVEKAVELLRDEKGGVSSIAAATAEAVWLLASLLANHDGNLARAKAAGAAEAVAAAVKQHEEVKGLRAKGMFLAALLQ